ncbi:MAG: 1-phosphofructokinase family hexose kinase [Acidobacteriaceae bacterium]|nr:1-phosphofructokinase family hexose kinase [Acidobacteriaceae bacterium]MBV9781866.1 1-phosphofructokinase family hexose kinase [Acidobacteriaceae bacterium]
MNKTVLTLTVNPAIDRTITVDRLVFGDRAYILSRTDVAGGRGINAARVLANFGANAIAITTSGRHNPKFEEHLKRDTFGKEIIKIRHNIRINLTIADSQGLAIKLNELGPIVSQAEQNRIAKGVEKLLPQASWLMLCGSVPPGVDAHFYTKLIRMAAKHNVETLLDTDGDPLLHGMEAQPSIVKPNQSEAERLLNRVLLTRTNYIEAVQQIKAMGAKFVVLSLGGRGAVAASADGVVEVVPPQIEALSPIGAGDAMGAAMVWALGRGDSFSDALRWGVAAGTASSKLPGLGLATLEQAKEIYGQTQITSVV